jgi:hypothetical protein
MTRTFVSPDFLVKISWISAKKTIGAGWRTEGVRSMLIKITLTLAVAIATVATAASYTHEVAAIGGLASGGGNLVPVW